MSMMDKITFECAELKYEEESFRLEYLNLPNMDMLKNGLLK